MNCKKFKKYLENSKELDFDFYFPDGTYCETCLDDFKNYKWKLEA